MEIMEEGNLMDRVRILLQRDQTYYNEHQKVILETVCPTVIGGYLDFPCVTTFVAIKMVTWWEESYFQLFRSPSCLFQAVSHSRDEGDNISVEKSITSREFVFLISQSSAKILNHMHILSQEALDHADLSVLTGTIGTAALIRNAVWIYNQQLIKTNLGVSLAKELKTFQNMSAALVERLLDLHCRLISLYILQDVDCLNWKAEHPFFEGERSSYTIQMWWLYVQNVKEDLWNSMPPTTAESVFSGILNESLTVLTSRYMQAKPKKARNELIIADISNLLLCIFKLLPAVCKSRDELLGCEITSNVIRDIHIKCHSLLTYFLIRGTPLSILYKNFKDGFLNAPCLMKKTTGAIEPWIIFASSGCNEMISADLQGCYSVNPEIAIKCDLQILLSRAQPEWLLLLKVMRMNDNWILYEILYHVIVEQYEPKLKTNSEVCKGVLCNDDCALISNIQSSITYLLLTIGNKNDIQKSLIKILEQVPEKWAVYFSHSQIWNQNRPFWIQTVQSLIQPTIKYIKEIVSENIKGGGSEEILTAYLENMRLAVNCLPEGVILLSTLLDNILPADVVPVGDFTLIQLMMMSLYDELGNESPISELLCRLESNKLEDFQKRIEEISQSLTRNFTHIETEEVEEIIVNHLLTEKCGRVSLKTLYDYLKHQADWLQIKLKIKSGTDMENNLLYKMFFIGNSEYDQFLSGIWVPKWASFINMPLGLSPEIIQNQLWMRPEFSEETKLSKHDEAIVIQLKSQFLPVIKCAT